MTRTIYMLGHFFYIGGISLGDLVCLYSKWKEKHLKSKTQKLSYAHPIVTLTLTCLLEYFKEIDLYHIYL